jgi:hypothetical protein
MKKRGRKGANVTGIPRSVMNREQSFSDGNSYSGIQRTVLRLPASPILYTTTVTTGVISSSYNIVGSQIGDFTTRFASTFDEYRILGVDFMIRPVTPGASGITVFALDEQVPGALTLQSSQERVGKRLPNGSVSARPVSMRFRTTSISELNYVSTGSYTYIGQLGIYTDATNYGSPVTVTPLWLVEPTFIVEFRGIIGG